MTTQHETIMNQITSLPQFMGAVAHCHRLHERLEATLRESAKDMDELKKTVFAMEGFFKEGLPVATSPRAPAPASEAGVPVPDTLLAEKTPSVAPRKHFDKVLAIVGASKEPPRFSEICAAWKRLGWDGSQDEKFRDIARAGVKTATRLGKLKHQGGRNGTYHLA